MKKNFLSPVLIIAAGAGVLIAVNVIRNGGSSIKPSLKKIELLEKNANDSSEAISERQVKNEKLIKEINESLQEVSLEAYNLKNENKQLSLTLARYATNYRGSKLKRDTPTALNYCDTFMAESLRKDYLFRQFSELREKEQALFSTKEKAFKSSLNDLKYLSATWKAAFDTCKNEFRKVEKMRTRNQVWLLAGASFNRLDRINSMGVDLLFAHKKGLGVSAGVGVNTITNSVIYSAKIAFKIKIKK